MIFWGERHIQLCNNSYWDWFSHTAYAAAIAQPLVPDSAIWHQCQPHLQQVWTTGASLALSSESFLVNGGDRPPRYCTSSYSAILTELGTVGGVIWHLSDVTEQVRLRRQVGDLTTELETERDRRLAEMGSQPQEEELHLIANTVPALIGYVDAEQRYRFVNQAYESWFGLPLSEFYGKPIREVLGDRAYQLVLPYVNQVLSGKRVTFESQLIYSHAGSRHVKATYIPQITEGGKVEGYVTLVSDITEQKQTEAALRQSEERLRVALKNSPITLFHQDRDLYYTWLYNNPAQGSSPSDVLGKRDVDLLPTAEAAIVSQIKQQVMATGIGAREEIKISLAGQECYFDLTVEPLKNHEEAIVGVTCAAIDISARKQIELALRHSETLMNALLASAPIGIAFFDRDLRYVHINEALANLNGLPREQHLGRTVAEVLPEYGSYLTEILQRVMHCQQPLLNQTMIGNNRLGVYYHCLVNYYPVSAPEGQLIGVGVTATDVTELKSAESALQQSEQRFRQLAESIQDVFWISDPISRRFSYVSPAYEQLWGRSCNRLYANYREWTDAIHPDDRNRVEAALITDVLQGEYDEEFRIIRPDGSMRWVRDRGFPVRDAAGKVHRITGIAADITDRKLAEEVQREQEVILRSMVEANPVGMVLADINGTIREANDAFLAIVGYPREAVQSGTLNLIDITPPEYIPLDSARTARAKATGISGSYEKVYIRDRWHSHSRIGGIHPV
ncbi:MAG: PAS domain-containing protein [Leptolyngbyaceae cyanobacterium SL_7_1]|nr:PAS domain-containing protein [Leptolyngbyaceae cyanobacterium SL_7_1]